MRHLKTYRAIRHIVREGSIRGGAEALAISPSALNRAIQAFEEEMNVLIFERIPGGVRLSAAGELMLDMIDRHLTEFDEMQTQLSDMRDGLSGTLRVSVGSDLDAGLVPAAFAEFERTFTGVSVEVLADDTTDLLQARRTDLAILSNPVTDDDVEMMYSQRIALTAWHAAPVAEPQKNLGVWDLVDHRLVLPPGSTGTRAAVDHLLRRRRLAAGVTSTLTAAQAAGHMVGEDVVCIFPDIANIGDQSSAKITRLPLSMGQIQFSVMRSTRMPLTRPTQAFLTILQRRLDAAT